MLLKVLRDMVTVFQVVRGLVEVVQTTVMVLAGITSVSIVVVQLDVSTIIREEKAPRTVIREALLMDAVGCRIFSSVYKVAVGMVILDQRGRVLLRIVEHGVVP